MQAIQKTRQTGCRGVGEIRGGEKEQRGLGDVFSNSPNTTTLECGETEQTALCLVKMESSEQRLFSCLLSIYPAGKPTGGGKEKRRGPPSAYLRRGSDCLWNVSSLMRRRQQWDLNTRSLSSLSSRRILAKEQYESTYPKWFVPCSEYQTAVGGGVKEACVEITSRNCATG